MDANRPGGSHPATLDTPATLREQREVTFAGEENPVAPGREATAGVAPNGRESVQGKDEQEEDFDFFRFLMETNEPPQEISATNRDWLRVDADGGA